MRIDVYLETDARGVHTSDHGRTWCILESIYKNKPLVSRKHITWMEHNRNGALLEGFLFALRQIRAAGAEVHVYADNLYICGHICKIPEWEGNGYMKRKGGPIEYRNLWSRIGEIIISQGLKVIPHTEIPEEKRMEFGKYENL